MAILLQFYLQGNVSLNVTFYQKTLTILRICVQKIIKLTKKVHVKHFREYGYILVTEYLRI